MTDETQRRKAVERTLSGYPFPDFSCLRDPNHPDYDREFTYALNFANYTYDHAELKDYACKYIEMANSEIPNLNKIPDWEFYHIGIMAWFRVKGAKLTCQQDAETYGKISRLYHKYNVSAPVKPVINLKKIHTEELIADLEGLIDDTIYRGKYIEPMDIISSDRGSIDLDSVKTHFNAQLDEVTDPELIDSFPDKDKVQAILERILRALGDNTQVHNRRKVRVMKPRKLNPSKMVRNLNYMKTVSFDKLSVHSIDPEKIVGSTVLWVYNTKTRKLGKYEATEGLPLMVKGSTILNYDGSSSQKTLRKPEEIIPKLMSAGKVEQRKIMDGIRAVASQLNGRVNKDCILVKVY